MKNTLTVKQQNELKALAKAATKIEVRIEKLLNEVHTPNDGAIKHHAWKLKDLLDTDIANFQI